MIKIITNMKEKRKKYTLRQKTQLEWIFFYFA